MLAEAEHVQKNAKEERQEQVMERDQLISEITTIMEVSNNEH